MNPFDFWSGMWRNGAAMTDTAFKLAETMQASGAVVRSRTDTIAAAQRNPLQGDYAELGRMLPEKVAAFGAAGSAAMADLQAIQRQALANWQQMLGITLQGRAPTAAEWQRMTARNAAMIERGARAGGKALAPIHRSATANARRLKRTG